MGWVFSTRQHQSPLVLSRLCFQSFSFLNPRTTFSLLAYAVSRMSFIVSSLSSRGKHLRFSVSSLTILIIFTWTGLLVGCLDNFRMSWPTHAVHCTSGKLLCTRCGGLIDFGMYAALDLFQFCNNWFEDYNRLAVAPIQADTIGWQGKIWVALSSTLAGSVVHQLFGPFYSQAELYISQQSLTNTKSAAITWERNFIGLLRFCGRLPRKRTS